MSKTGAACSGDIQLETDYSAEWMPVYLEPMQFSGERITIAIAAMGCDKKHRIIQTIPLAALTSAFGQRGKEILLLSSHVASSLKTHLKDNIPLAFWEPPFKTVYAGRVTTSYDQDIDSILEHVKNNMACFSAYEITEEPKAETVSIWRDEILGQVMSKRPSLERNFNRPFMSSDSGNKFSIDYVGNDIILNFAELNPRKGISGQRNNASNKILQLNSIRRHHPSIKTNHLSLYLKTPPSDILSKNDFGKMSRYLSDLTSNADDIKIEITTVHDASEVTERILEDAIN